MALIKACKKKLPKSLSAYDHVRAVDAALYKAESWGIEAYLPKTRLLPGQELKLDPPDMMSRPILRWRSDQAASGFTGAWFMAEVPGIRIRRLAAAMLTLLRALRGVSSLVKSQAQIVERV